MICLSRTNCARPSRLLCVTASSCDGGGKSFCHVRQHLRRRLCRVDLSRGLGERLLVALQVRLGDGQQVGKRGGDHLVGGEHLLVGVRAVGERAVGPLQQVALQPFLVVLERGDDGVVGGLELGEQRGVFHIGERRGHVAGEEVAVAVDLLDGDLGVDPWWVIEVLAGLGQDIRHQLQSG